MFGPFDIKPTKSTRMASEDNMSEEEKDKRSTINKPTASSNIKRSKAEQDLEAEGKESCSHASVHIPKKKEFWKSCAYQVAYLVIGESQM
jgi:hypothetical protein